MLNFDARILMTSFFLLGLFGREFSTLLTVLALMAELLKDDFDASGKINGCCACSWLMILFLLPSRFLSLSFFYTVHRYFYELSTLAELAFSAMHP